MIQAFNYQVTSATAKVSKRKMKRHGDGKRAASIGVEQFDEWKYISTYGNAIKGGDLGERGKLGEKGRKKERERDGMRIKKKIPEKEEKIFP